MADIEALLAETGDSPPCGPALEYDPRFMALESAARVKPEQQIGDTIIPAEQPDWGAVAQEARQLFTRTKDLRLAILLIRALTRTDNLAGLRDGLALLHGLLDRYWTSVHPVPDPDDPDDLIMRLNALAPLIDADAVLADVRGALLVVSGPHGRISVRDILVTTGRLPAADGEVVPSQPQIDSAIAHAAENDPRQIDAVRECAALTGAIHALLIDKVGSDRAPDLRALSNLLKPAVQACAATAAGSATDGAAEADSGSLAAAAIAQASAGSAPRLPASGDIRSREEAMHALDAVCRFYERTEPGNPAPLLIRRAQRLINKSFVEIMQDLAPDSLDQIRLIAGLKSES